MHRKKKPARFRAILGALGIGATLALSGGSAAMAAHHPSPPKATQPCLLAVNGCTSLQVAGASGRIFDLAVPNKDQTGMALLDKNQLIAWDTNNTRDFIPPAPATTGPMFYAPDGVKNGQCAAVLSLTPRTLVLIEPCGGAGQQWSAVPVAPGSMTVLYEPQNAPGLTLTIPHGTGPYTKAEIRVICAPSGGQAGCPDQRWTPTKN